LVKLFIFSFTDFPRVQVGPENPVMVERDETAELKCEVDSKPPVTEVSFWRPLE
jgi:echinoid protein